MTQNQCALTGKTAFITGAAQRIGAQITRTLHAAGMDIAIHYRQSEQAAQALKQELEEARPDSIMLIQADLHDTDVFPGLTKSINTRFGRLDLLVNNASSFCPTKIGQVNQDEWNDLIGTNLKAPFFLAQAVAPMLRESGGSIINLVDIHAERPLKNHPVYSIAKAGNAMMVKALALELGPEIRVNGIAPGAILWPANGISEQEKQEILNLTALKRAGSPEDIAQAVLFLARDADYITGQIINVDAGRTLRQ
ncbi:FolM Alternative dihydrofolate reductase 1 [hydrothermal vent metagenome]|uniref:FolM Alternative dihydrofolate reductase 1 n=1 Tax=hydrothermal vent metagenome TaxID=652676 RepID=A0A3B1C0F5_9ZZZZ